MPTAGWPAPSGAEWRDEVRGGLRAPGSGVLPDGGLAVITTVTPALHGDRHEFGAGVKGE